MIEAVSTPIRPMVVETTDAVEGPVNEINLENIGELAAATQAKRATLLNDMVKNKVADVKKQMDIIANFTEALAKARASKDKEEVGDALTPRKTYDAVGLYIKMVYGMEPDECPQELKDKISPEYAKDALRMWGHQDANGQYIVAWKLKSLCSLSGIDVPPGTFNAKGGGEHDKAITTLEGIASALKTKLDEEMAQLNGLIDKSKQAVDAAFKVVSTTDKGMSFITRKE